MDLSSTVSIEIKESVCALAQSDLTAMQSSWWQPSPVSISNRAKILVLSYAIRLKDERWLVLVRDNAVFLLIQYVLCELPPCQIIAASDGITHAPGAAGRCERSRC